MNTLVMAVLSIALSVTAQFSLKAGMSSGSVRELLAQPFTSLSALSVLTNKYVMGGLLLYGFGAVVWLGVLSKWDVSKAYPLVGLGFVFSMGIGSIVGEQVSFARVVGAALICAGVFVISRS